MKLEHSRLGNNNHRHYYNNWKNDGLNYDYYYLIANKEFANLPYDIESRPEPQKKSIVKKVFIIVFLWWYLLLTSIADSFNMGRNLIKVGKKYVNIIIIFLTAALTDILISLIFHTGFLNIYTIIVTVIVSVILGQLLFKHYDLYKSVNGEYEKVSIEENSENVRKTHNFLSRKSWTAVIGKAEDRDYIDISFYDKRSDNVPQKYQYLKNEKSLFDEGCWRPHGEFYTDDAKYFVTPDL